MQGRSSHVPAANGSDARIIVKNLSGLTAGQLNELELAMLAPGRIVSDLTSQSPSATGMGLGMAKAAELNGYAGLADLPSNDAMRSLSIFAAASRNWRAPRYATNFLCSDRATTCCPLAWLPI